MNAETRKVVLVTGSSSGFGRLTVETLARQGYKVFAGIREIETKNRDIVQQLRDWATKTESDLTVVELDVRNEALVEQAIQAIITSAGRLDVVVNNAGVLAAGPLEAYSLEQVQYLFDTNVFGILRVNRAALPQMRAQGSGLLIQLSSVVGRQALPFIGLYSATKFAVEGLTEAYRLELAALGIDAVMIEPGAYPTNGLANPIPAADGQRVGAYAPFLQKVSEFMSPGGQGENPQDVADTIAALIATPAGKRPIRTVLASTPQREGISAINGVADQVARATIEATGWEPFTAFKLA